MTLPPERCRALLAHIESLERDAARYRWLRDTNHWTTKEGDSTFSGTRIRGVKVSNYYNGGLACTDWAAGEQLDATIDAARKEVKP